MVAVRRLALVFFFFSSRRRHTRYWRDWSSDVCSSDLDQHALAFQANPSAVREVGKRLVDGLPRRADQLRDLLLRQVVGDAQRAALLRAEPLRQLKQRSEERREGKRVEIVGGRSIRKM